MLEDWRVLFLQLEVTCIWILAGSSITSWMSADSEVEAMSSSVSAATCFCNKLLIGKCIASVMTCLPNVQGGDGDHSRGS